MGLFGNDNYGYGGGPRYGFHASWVVGLIVIIFGVIRYAAHTQVNPVTGESQHITMTPAQEITLGIDAAPRMAAAMGRAIPASDPRAALVAEVGARLAAAGEPARSPYAGHFQYHLLDDPRTVNAFALPGGQIFITRALFERLSNEAELAGVLGHETGHVICRHSAQQIEKSQLGQTISTGVAIGASGDRHGQVEAIAAQASIQMRQLAYGREDESQADAKGLQYMAEAGYDPREMIGVMKVLESLGGQHAEILSTHPTRRAASRTSGRCSRSTTTPAAGQSSSPRAARSTPSAAARERGVRGR